MISSSHRSSKINESSSSLVEDSSSSASIPDVSSTEEEIENEKLKAYNALPIEAKMQLIAEIVDERAQPVNGQSLRERGYGMLYYVYADHVFFQISSGAGIGHPIFIIDYDSESITPREGVIRVSANEYQMMTNINLSTVSKEMLYDSYLLNKEA